MINLCEVMRPRLQVFNRADPRSVIQSHANQHQPFKHAQRDRCVCVGEKESLDVCLFKSDYNLSSVGGVSVLKDI